MKTSGTGLHFESSFEDILTRAEVRCQLQVSGISFRNASLSERGMFTLTNEQIKGFYSTFQPAYSKYFFILSTCNRMEIYSYGNITQEVLKFLSKHYGFNHLEWSKRSYNLTSDEAVGHIFRVASGMDSQILGDCEIAGQLKSAFMIAKSFNFINGYLEKIYNQAIQVSREIKSKTTISTGTTSVSYAAIQQLRQQKLQYQNSINVCLIGLGKIGLLTLKNLRHYFPKFQITVLTRDFDKLERIRKEFDVNVVLYKSEIMIPPTTNILIMATGADGVIITKNDLEKSQVKMILDLSVPSNISEDLLGIDGLKIFNIDHMCATIQQNLTTRRKDLPLAESIIENHLDIFRKREMTRAKYAKLDTPVIIS